MTKMVELTRLSKVKLTPDSYANKIGNTIVLSRSFNAQIPLFYVAFEDCLWYCDNYPSLVRAIISANIPLSLNKSYIYDQLKFQTPLTSETLFHPIRFLRVGEMHHVDSKSGELIKTEFSDRSSSKPLTSREFSDFLQQQLSNIEEKDAVFHISSGLDSSLLAIMHSKLGHNRVRLASCKTRGNGASNELENVERLAKDISAELNIYDLTDIDIFSMGKQLIAYQGYPVAHPSNLLEYALDSYILNDGASTIINGKGPDDCLAGYVSHQDMYSDRFTHLNRLTVTSDSILTELFGGAYGNATNYWENSKQPLSLRERINYDARAITDSWNHIHHSFAKGFNCEILSPFMDPVIRSGLFALPDEERINNGKQKAFLRNTFADIYPDYIINQPKAAFTLDLRPYFIDYSSTHLQQYLFDNFSTLEPIIDINIVKKMIDSTLNGKRNFGWQIWSLCLVNYSVEQFGIY